MRSISASRQPSRAVARSYWRGRAEVQTVRSVDDADFTAFVAGASRRLLRSAYLITGDLSSAEDLLQTSLERAYRRWSYCRRWGTPEAYVRRIIVNAATDRWRREQALRKVSLNEAQVPPL